MKYLNVKNLPRQLAQAWKRGSNPATVPDDEPKVTVSSQLGIMQKNGRFYLVHESEAGTFWVKVRKGKLP